MKTLTILFALCATLHATEYFVAHDGREGAFKTIDEGVTALKPGDTLTVLPGEYHESIQTAISGTREAPITIRAWRAGTVLIRGDVDLGEFKPAPGLRNVFVTEFKNRPESVAERSTWRVLEPKLSLPEVEMVLGSYLQDEKAELLYVHTSDSRARVQEKDTRYGNPGIAVASHLVPPDAKPIEWSKVELHREGDTFAPLDFKDFIPAADNPLAKAADGEPVGLEPGVFR